MFRAGFLMSAHAIHESDEIDLLDIAVALAEWWKAFLIVPLAAAAIGYVIGVALPARYTATLELPLVEGGVQASILRAAYSAPSVTVKLDNKKGLILAAKSETASAAGNAIEVARSLIAGAASAWIEEEQKLRADYLSALASSEDTVFLTALTDNAFDRTEIHGTEAFVEIVRGAEAALKRSGTRPIVLALISGLASAVLLGIVALFWSALDRAARQPEGAQKVERIKAAFHLRSIGSS